MCAVFGIVGEYDGTQARNALGTLQHRGPDRCGIVERPGLFFAHHRLSIIDPHARADQPLEREGVLLSFNGEIYNFRQLRRELGGPFVSDSDAEVLLAAYLQWGERFVDRLVGMFAIAIFAHGSVLLFRDRLGKKPLFYLHEGNRLIFASEIKAIRPFLKQIRMNDDALMSYLTYMAPTPPHTFYEGIHKLEAGCRVIYENGKLDVGRYYDLLDTPPATISRADIALTRLDDALNASVALRLDADVPMASLLSGGIDSAMVAALAKAHGKPLHTFTMGYSEYAQYDERRAASQTAQGLGLENTAVEISGAQFIEAGDAVFDTLDEPLNDPAAVALSLLFDAIKKAGYRVVLSGEVGDELFLGYRQYFEYLDIETMKGLQHKNWLRKYFRAHFSMNREWEWYKRIFDDTLLFRTCSEKFTDLQKNALMRRNVRDNASLAYLQPWRERFERSAHTDESIWYSTIDLTMLQAEYFLAKLDRVSMAHSIESRTPFLDHRLAETVFGIEPSLRYRTGVTKALLREIAKKYLPDAVLQRKKRGFSTPYIEWLFASGRIDLISEVNAQTGLFKEDVLQRYIDTARRGRFKQHVWGLYVLSVWMKKHLL